MSVSIHQPAIFRKFVAPDDDRGEFSGLASTFNGVDAYGDTILPGAFRNTLDAHHARDTMPALLFGHDVNQPIGKWTDLHEEPDGLHATGRLTLAVAKARDVRALMADGVMGLSIGFTADPGDVETHDGGRYFHRVNLLEISATPLPANSDARVTSIKAALDSPRTFERQVRDALGLSARQAKRLMAGGYSALVRDASGDEAETELGAILRAIRTTTQHMRFKK